MAKIDELNFQLILDDKKFNKQIKDNLKAAKDLNTQLSAILTIKGKISGLSKEEAASLSRAESLEHKRKMHVEQQAAAAAKRRQEEAKEQEIIKRTNALHQSRNRLMREAVSLAGSYFSIMGAQKLVSNLVRVTSEFEMQRTTLRAMLQDVGGADSVFEQIKSLAVMSPFSFKDLVTYTKQLSAYSVPMGELYDTTKMLADVSAGLGVGMDRLVLAYGQVRSAAFLRGQEVRQFTEAGIPILDELAKQFSEIEERAVSVGEVFDKISARQVPFEMVAKVFKDMTSEGGKFFQMQEVQASTLQGKLSNLKDAYEIMFSEIGEKISPQMKNLVDGLRRLMSNYEEVGRQIMVMVATYGTARVATSLYMIATKKLTLAQTSLGKAFKSVSSILTKNSYVAIAAGVAILVGQLYKAVTAQDEFTKAMNETNESFAKTLATEVAELDFLYAKLKSATEGTIEYDNAKKQLYNKYGKYIDELENEGVAVNNLVTIYQNLKDKIEDSARARFQLTATKNVEEAYANTIDDIYTGRGGIFTFERFRKELDLTAAEAQAAWGLITGTITRESLETMDDYADLLEKIDTRRISLGLGDSGPVKAQEFLEALIGVVDNAKQSYMDAKKAMEELYDAANSGGGNGKKTPLPAFVETVQSFLGTDKAKNPFKEIWADEYSQYSEYLETLKNRYAKLEQDITLAGNAQSKFVQGYKDEQAMIRRIASAFDLPRTTNIFDYVTGKKDDTGGSSTEKSPKQIELERQIELVKKLRDAYEQLTPYVSDERMAGTLTGLFSNSITGDGDKAIVNALKYEEQLVSLAQELAKYDKEGAARVLLSLGVDGAKDLVGEYKTAYDQMKAYADFMNSWSEKDFSVEGSGIIFDLSKIASDLQTKIADIEGRGDKARDLLAKAQKGNEQALLAVREKYGEEFWQKYISQGEAAINELVAKEKAAARTVSQEKVNDLAKKYVSEGYFLNNIDLKDFGDKTIFQLASMRERLQDFLDKDPLDVSVEFKQKLANGNITDLTKLYSTDETGKVLNDVDIDAFVGTLSEAERQEYATEIATLRLMKATQQAGIKFEDLSAAIKKVVSGDLKNLTQEEGKAAMSIIKSCIAEFQSLFGAIEEYATEAGLNGLSAFAKGAGEVMDTLMPIAERLMQGDWIGAIVTGVTALATKIFQAATAQERLANAIEEAAINQRILNSEMAISMGVEGVFGKDQYRELVNAYDEAASAYKAASADIEEANKKLSGASGNDSNGWGTAVGVGAGAALGAAIGVWFFGIGALIGAAVGAGVGAIVGATVDVANELDNYTLSLQEMADKIGAPLLTEDGVFNKETLQQILDTYTDLDEESVNFIKNLIANVEIFEQACDVVADSLTDMFSNVADDVADAFITAFKESGEAALDYADIIDGVATSIVKMVIKSALLKQIFNEDMANDVASRLVSGDLAGAVEIVDKAMQDAQELAPTIQQWLESMQGYFKMGEGNSGSSVTEGMQALTESTGDLLASYLNAIRADVSFSKSQRDNIINLINRIVGLLPQSPRLVDYLTQIQSNTYNTAEATRAILSELRNVMTNDGGQTAIRTYM